MPDCECGHPNVRHGLGHPCNVEECPCSCYKALSSWPVRPGRDDSGPYAADQTELSQPTSYGVGPRAFSLGATAVQLGLQHHLSTGHRPGRKGDRYDCPECSFRAEDGAS